MKRFSKIALGIALILSIVLLLKASTLLIQSGPGRRREICLSVAQVQRRHCCRMAAL